MVLAVDDHLTIGPPLDISVTSAADGAKFRKKHNIEIKKTIFFTNILKVVFGPDSWRKLSLSSSSSFAPRRRPCRRRRTTPPSSPSPLQEN